MIALAYCVGLMGAYLAGLGAGTIAARRRKMVLVIRREI